MAYYRNYRKYSSLPRRSKVTKEKIVNLNEIEVLNLKKKYQTFTYEKIFEEEQRLEKKIIDNLDFIKKSEEFIKKSETEISINGSSMIRIVEEINYQLYQKYEIIKKFDEPLNEIDEKLRRIFKIRDETYNKHKSSGKVPFLPSAIIAYGIAIFCAIAVVTIIPIAVLVFFPIFFYIMKFTQMSSEKTPLEIMPKTDEEILLEEEKEKIIENKKILLVKIQKEKKEEENKSKKLNDLIKYNTELKKKIVDLKIKVDVSKKENLKIPEAIKFILPNIKKRVKERERSAKIAAFDNKARSGSQVVKDELLRYIKNKSKWKCPYCDLSSPASNAVADHIYPINKGGLSTPANMVLVCEDCNKKKTNLTLRSFCKKVNFDYHEVCERLEKQNKHV
jgi:5-methylcytosine-specific restriction endonuclease McrA